MEWIEIIGILFLVTGFVLVGIEMVLPGFGAPGISGIVCLIVGIICSSDNLEEGITNTLKVIVVLALLMTVLLGLLHYRKVKSPLILSEEILSDKGYLESSDLDYLLGKQGIAITDLRPAGKGDFEGIVLDVFSEGPYIERENEIVIVKVNKRSLFVRKAGDERC